MENNIKIEYAPINFFVEKIHTKLKATDFFSNQKNNKKESKQDLGLSFKISMHTPKKFKDMFICRFAVDGLTADGLISLSAIVAGVFYVKDIKIILSNEKFAGMVQDRVLEDVYPYAKNLLSNIVQYLPGDQFIHLPTTFRELKKQIAELKVNE